MHISGVSKIQSISSLYFIEGYSKIYKIRFGYGLLYEHRGQILHGLNRYYLLVGVGILKFNFYLIFLSTGKHLNCTNIVNVTVLYGVCYSLVPLCINYKAKEQQYQKEIS